MTEEKSEPGAKVSWLVPVGLIVALVSALALGNSHLPNVFTIKSENKIANIEQCINSAAGRQLFRRLACTEKRQASAKADPTIECIYEEKYRITAVDGLFHRYITAADFKYLSGRQRSFLKQCGSP